MPSCFYHYRLTALPGIATSQTHAHWHIYKQGMRSPLSGECVSLQVIYSCVLGTHPHAIKMLFGCALVTDQQFIHPSSPPFFSFTFPCVLFTRVRLFSSCHTWHPPFCQGCRLIDDCCHLSSLFPLSISFLCDVLIVLTTWELLQEVAFALLARCSYFHWVYALVMIFMGWMSRCGDLASVDPF